MERIFEALKFNTGSRFIILYGVGVEDSFVTDELNEIDILTALDQTLHQNGFKRVVFVSPHKPVYTLQNENSTEAQNSDPDLSPGPLGFQESSEDADQFAYVNTMGDIHALRLLDAYMKDLNECPTAVVIDQAETYIRFFEGSRILAGLMGEWERLPSSNPNACFFLFSADNYNDLCEVSRTLTIPELRSFILRRRNEPAASCNLLQIRGPEEKEMTNLLRYARHRINPNLKINKEYLPTLAGWMASEGGKARLWLQKLAEVDRVDADTVRSLGWFSAYRGSEISAKVRLNSLVGKENIKKRVNEMANWITYKKKSGQYNRENAPLLHMIFSGNPGTGKTTVARLIGELYHELGILKRGHLVEAKGKDLIAEYVGGTAIKTNNIIDQAYDGVLFIDEAYVLTEPERGGFGQEAVDTLLTRMEDDRDHLVVIAAGYPGKMVGFRNSNPGLPRRFPAENFLEFGDFSESELWEITRKMLESRAIPFADKVEEILRRIIHNMIQARDETFGNAGEMRNFADALERKRAARIVENNLPQDAPLEIEDISEEYASFLPSISGAYETIQDELKNLTGLKRAKDFVEKLKKRAEYDQLRELAHPDAPRPHTLKHLVFTGNPGTGKTTIARLIGKLYHSLGILRKGHVIEVSRSDLVAGYVGQTALKTLAKVKEALDGILFIDEAYSLVGEGNDFGQESIDTLVKAMDDYKHRLVIIVAGYTREMERFLSTNPGLRSRFNQRLDFPDYKPNELGEILTNAARSEGFTLPNPVIEKAVHILKEAQERDQEHFGNARAVLDLFEQMKTMLAARVMSTPTPKEAMDSFISADVPSLPKMQYNLYPRAVGRTIVEDDF